MHALTEEALRVSVDAVPFWFHSIELPFGITTPGFKSVETLRLEMAACRLPDLTGRTVLDIGAWDGSFSFACERAGADRVVALDHFTWSMDWEAARRYTEDVRARGDVARPIEETDAWKPDTLPGRAGFDLAHRALNSRVEPVVGDILDLDVGTFDIVLYLGVLYHMRNPLVALERVRASTRELAVIETDAIAIPGHESTALCSFYERDELNADFTNWWSPNAAALAGLCRAAGFRDCIVYGAPGRAPSTPRTTLRAKLQHLAGTARRELGRDPVPDTAITHYRAIAHAWV